MSDSAEDECSLFSTAFKVGLDGSYRRVEADAAGTSTRSRVGKGAERRWSNCSDWRKHQKPMNARQEPSRLS
jgi:hypothetical protein